MALDTELVSTSQDLSIVVYPDMYTFMYMGGALLVVCCGVVLFIVTRKSRTKKA
jgi:hypothetical protein